MIRPIRSFVRRTGRTTGAQRRAIETLGPRYVIGGEGEIDLADRFGRRAPCVVEVGFGAGDALLALAQRHPERDFLGVEVHPPGVGRVLAALAEHGIGNVRVLVEDAAGVFAALAEHGIGNVRVLVEDAAGVFASRIPPGSLESVLVWFPDPWPKKRHHKRRLVGAAFAAAVRRCLAPGGRLRVATDWEPYAREMLAGLDAAPGWRNLAGRGCFAERPAARPVTRFEARGERLGHSVFDLAFERVE